MDGYGSVNLSKPALMESVEMTLNIFIMFYARRSMLHVNIRSCRVSVFHQASSEKW